MSSISAFRNRDFTLEGLKEVATEVTRLYQENEYMLARAYVPKQKIIDGVVTISVIEGELGSVDVSKGKYYLGSYIESWFNPLKGKAVEEGDLKRAILLLNDTPSLNVETILKKGKKPGTADLTTVAKDNYPIKLDLQYDNHGNTLVSRSRYRVDLSITDPKFGSTISLLGIMGDSFPDNLYVGLDYQIPITHHGTRLGGRYINADYIVGKEFKALDVEGNSEIYGGYIMHPFIRSRDKNLKTTLGFDSKHMEEFILNEPKSNDVLSVIYLRMEYDSLDRFLGKTYMSINYSQGLNSVLHSIGRKDLEASRFGASGKFGKINIDFARVQQLWRGITLYLKASGQFSFSKLVTPEQFSIGGASTVRGYELSKFLGDSGYTSSAEISSPIPFTKNINIKDKKFSDMFRVALFGDFGKVFRRGFPVAGQKHTDSLNSFGVGARLYLFDRLNVKCDVAYPQHDIPDEGHKPTVYIQANFKVF
ncbi:MAG: Heme/hemopexin transporter protein HuxB precursor [Candidatus Scalindua rubra]|uniref:Heme/hemopexin transporter protein HuxB n=1 Tax=Candidatus Scalindua rubra TaxID=1872076 RepID=A0A1E3X2M0_9BACT|nr:MAG: Heme/hemopexin transporter protein HuxB precursor [Candidatus Scalindua rubra]